MSRSPALCAKFLRLATVGRSNSGGRGGRNWESTPAARCGKKKAQASDVITDVTATMRDASARWNFRRSTASRSSYWEAPAGRRLLPADRR